jgi:acyl-CoA synthetase (AMP-forming)/AMP-acid ligase II
MRNRRERCDESPNDARNAAQERSAQYRPDRFRARAALARQDRHARSGLGLAKGDCVAVLAYNRVEWMEIYAALAKAGLATVPLNFRLVGPEIRYIAQHCGARADRAGRSRERGPRGGDRCRRSFVLPIL